MIAAQEFSQSPSSSIAELSNKKILHTTRRTSSSPPPTASGNSSSSVSSSSSSDEEKSKKKHPTEAKTSVEMAKIVVAPSHHKNMMAKPGSSEDGEESEEHLHDSLDDQGVADSGVGSSSERTSTVSLKIAEIMKCSAFMYMYV